MTISVQKKLALRKQAHALKPVVIIGNKGLTDPVHVEIDRALTDHELIKVKLGAEDQEQTVAEIVQRHQAVCVQQVGHVAAFYRKSEKGKERGKKHVKKPRTKK